MKGIIEQLNDIFVIEDYDLAEDILKIFKKYNLDMGRNGGRLPRALPQGFSVQDSFREQTEIERVFGVVKTAFNGDNIKYSYESPTHVYEVKITKV